MEKFRLSDSRPRRLTPVQIATADSMLHRHRGQMKLNYYGWQVVRAGVGTFRLLILNAAGHPIGVTYGGVGDALDIIENVIANIN